MMRYPSYLSVFLGLRFHLVMPTSARSGLDMDIWRALSLWLSSVDVPAPVLDPLKTARAFLSFQAGRESAEGVLTNLPPAGRVLPKDV
ncbi:hypothetical protein [Frog virus 3]